MMSSNNTYCLLLYALILSNGAQGSNKQRIYHLLKLKPQVCLATQRNLTIKNWKRIIEQTYQRRVQHRPKR